MSDSPFYPLPRTRPTPADAIATKFVTDAFKTEVDEVAVTDVAEAVTDCVVTLRDRVTSDDRLETLLRSQPGGSVLISTDTVENEDPEPLTQRAVIEPLLTELGYEEHSVEVGNLSDEYGDQALLLSVSLQALSPLFELLVSYIPTGVRCAQLFECTVVFQNLTAHETTVEEVSGTE